MKNTTDEGTKWLSDGVFTAIIEMGAYVNMDYVNVYAMPNSTWPTGGITRIRDIVDQGVALAANTVNTVLIPSDPGYGRWDGVFFIAGERNNEATWSFIVKNAYIVSGDWT